MGDFSKVGEHSRHPRLGTAVVVCEVVTMNDWAIVFGRTTGEWIDYNGTVQPAGVRISWNEYAGERVEAPAQGQLF